MVKNKARRKSRKQFSLIANLIWLHLGYTSGGTCCLVAKLKQVCNVFECKAMGQTLEGLQVSMGISGHIYILGRHTSS